VREVPIDVHDHHGVGIGTQSGMLSRVSTPTIRMLSARRYGTGNGDGLADTLGDSLLPLGGRACEAAGWWRAQQPMPTKAPVR